MVQNEIEIEENKTGNKVLLFVNSSLLFIGNAGGPLILRLYFNHGGNRIWLSSLVQTAGWPVMLIPFIISYVYRRRRSPDNTAKVFQMTLPLWASSIFVGIITGFVDFLYASGVAKLPVSTSSLLIATQLAFTAAFAWVMVRQKFTSYTVNAIFLLTIGAGVLAMHASSDRPKGVTNKEYLMGFIMTLGAAGTYGFVLPFVELTYKKVKTAITYSLVMEFQLILCIVSSLVCIGGMIINKDFKAIPREARNYELGPARYYVVVVFNCIIWQTFFLGAVGVIFSASSLLSGIIIALTLPATEVLAVIFFHESFQSQKGVSLALCIWGFISYFYGEVKQAKKEEEKVKLGSPAKDSSPSYANP